MHNAVKPAAGMREGRQVNARVQVPVESGVRGEKVASPRTYATVPHTAVGYGAGRATETFKGLGKCNAR